MAILWNLSTAGSNKAAMWKDKQGRAALLHVVRESQKAGEAMQQARQFALGALRNLADEPKNKLSMWNDADNARRLLIEAANMSGSPDQVSSRRAFKALTSLVHESANRISMWNDEGKMLSADVAATLAAGAAALAAGTAGVASGALAGALGASAKGGGKVGARALIIKYASDPWTPENSDTHTSALIALQALSVENSNKEAVWNNAQVRAALVASAKLSQPEAHKARLCAVSTLKNLTTEASVMEPMWNDENVRGVLVAAALPGADDAPAAKARAAALGALRNIASATPNKEPMWSDEEGARAAIIAAAEVADENVGKDAREARMHAIAALRSFSSVSAEKTDPLWQGCEAAKNALIAAAKLSTTEHADHKSREYAVAALRHSS